MVGVVSELRERDNEGGKVAGAGILESVHGLGQQRPWITVDPQQTLALRHF